MLIEKKALTGLECKLLIDAVETDTATNVMSFSGYGSVFGNIDDHGDIIEKGAFAKSLLAHAQAGTQPLMCLNHQVFDALPIGRWTSIVEDNYGLKVTGELLDTTAGRDTYTALKAGAIKGLSIGFYAVAWAMASKSDEFRRTISEVELAEISVVTIPANTLAQVNEVKANMDEMGVRDLERLLRDCGLSRKHAEAVTSQFESKKFLADRKAEIAAKDALSVRIDKLLGK